MSARNNREPEGSKKLARVSQSQIAAERALLADLRILIAQTRESVARTVNAALVLLHWEIGYRIRRNILAAARAGDGDQIVATLSPQLTLAARAGYGDQIVATLSPQLSAEFGRGYTNSALWRMIRFAEAFPDSRIVAGLVKELGWSHFVEIIPLDDPLKREFYAELCRIERWSVRVLRDKIQGMLFERTALSRKPRKLAKRELKALREEGRMSPDLVFRDPYLLDFLGLKDTYSEGDLEEAILRDIERFMLELGAGFSFVARQKRITIDGEDFHLDLLFYHRKLRRLIAIDLKLGKLKAGDKGQMELYLRWLEKYEMETGEDPPLGLILCSDQGDEQVELLRLDRSGIRVATYLTELPARAILEKKLHEVVKNARARIQKRSEPERR